MTIRVELPRAYRELLEPHRWKIWEGGRGAARSWSFGRVLVARAYRQKLRIMCLREYQTSIEDSVHALLKGQIDRLGLSSAFHVTDRYIESSVGSMIVYRGMHGNLNSIKSMEDFDIAWIEEGQSMTRDSIEILPPTLRKPGSEIWISMNTGDPDDPVRGLLDDPHLPGVSKHVTYLDNPFFNETLDEERKRLYRVCQSHGDMSAYDSVWLGALRRISDALIFKGCVSIEAFDEPVRARFYYGADFGFSNDPSTLVRAFITENGDGTSDLWITHAVFGYQVETYDLPAFYKGGWSKDGTRRWDGVPGAQAGDVRADAARPETISQVRGLGFNISAAKKWAGSVEDGITYLKGFRRIHIHQRNREAADESRNYKYKVDKKTGKVTSDIVDAHNHFWDALRYAMDDFIHDKRPLVVSEKALSASAAQSLGGVLFQPPAHNTAASGFFRVSDAALTRSQGR